MDATPADDPRLSAKILARRLIKYREMRRETQTQLASDAGISRKTLNWLESGVATGILVRTLEALAHALHVTPDQLLGYDDQPRVQTPDVVVMNMRRIVLARVGEVCRSVIVGRALHPLADCMVAMSDAGKSAAAIGRDVGLSEASADFVLGDEHEARPAPAVLTPSSLQISA